LAKGQDPETSLVTGWQLLVIQEAKVHTPTISLYRMNLQNLSIYMMHVYGVNSVQLQETQVFTRHGLQKEITIVAIVRPTITKFGHPSSVSRILPNPFDLFDPWPQSIKTQDICHRTFMPSLPSSCAP